MHCRNHVFSFTVIALLFVPADLRAQGVSSPGVRPRAAVSTASSSAPVTQVRLRWAPRPGISRYRLQLARDVEFSDIVFDRVILGSEYAVSDLAPGRYFWRVAALTANTLAFSSAGVIDVNSENRPSLNPGEESRPPQRGDTNTAAPTSSPAGGAGWRALIGEVGAPVLAHLRSPSTQDLIAISNEGVVYALAADSGVVLWVARADVPRTRLARTSALAIEPLIVRSAKGLDNVAILSNGAALALDGGSGRELWRVSLPSPASGASVLNDARNSELFIVDNSRQRLFLLDGNTGKLIGQTQLSGRAFGEPVAFDYAGLRGVMLAFDNGRIEILDRAGKTMRSGNAGSPATTPPLFVNGPRGGLVLVGTRSGLTALDGGDLRALGRVALKDDAPRGRLTADDLDGDGVAKVIMLTDRGHAIAVNAADGKILWDAPGAGDAEAIALADVNGDHVRDVLLAGGQTFAMAFSGRDGSLIWKDEFQPSFVANHATVSIMPRSLVAVPFGSGTLLIGIDPSRLGLRAIEFSRGSVPPNLR